MTGWWQEWAVAAGLVAAGWVASRFSDWLLRAVTRRLVSRTRTILDDTIVAAGRFPLRAGVFLWGVSLAVARLSVIPDAWRPGLDRFFFAATAFLLFLFLYQLIGGLIRWYAREIAHKTETELDDEFLNLFRYVAQIGLTITAVIIVLGRYGIEVSALVTTLGIGSLAVALAAQETLGNMVAGFTIMVDRPFKVGDRIGIQDIDTWGDVQEIGLRSTRILTLDHRLVSIPNAVIGKGLVVNYSDPDAVIRLQTHVGIAYGCDIEQARAVMVAAIREQPWVMPNRPVDALFVEFGDSALVFRVRCWIESYVDTRRIIDRMNTSLYHALREAGIEIPFPQRDLHLVSSRVALSPAGREDGGTEAAGGA